MGVNEQEQQKVQNLQYDEVYNRIKENGVSNQYP